HGFHRSSGGSVTMALPACSAIELSDHTQVMTSLADVRRLPDDYLDTVPLRVFRHDFGVNTLFPDVRSHFFGVGFVGSDAIRMAVPVSKPRSKGVWRNGKIRQRHGEWLCDRDRIPIPDLTIPK